MEIIDIGLNDLEPVTFNIQDNELPKSSVNFGPGIELLMKNPLQHRIYAIDKYWFRLQEKDNWHLITPLSVVQRAGFSNIEQRVTDFTKPMLDLDKNSYFQQLLSLKK